MKSELFIAMAAVLLRSAAGQLAPGCALRCAKSFKCVKANQICDRKRDCPNGEDEICPTTTSYGHMCLVSDSQICDGFNDCPDSSDENGCILTTPPLVNLGNDWLWTWPLVGAVLCALVCTAVALSLRYMRLKRQRLQQARRLAATERLAAAGHGVASQAAYSPPSYDEITSVPYGGCPNMGYCAGPAEMPPDYLEAVLEAERQCAAEKQLLRQSALVSAPADDGGQEQLTFAEEFRGPNVEDRKSAARGVLLGSQADCSSASCSSSCCSDSSYGSALVAARALGPAPSYERAEAGCIYGASPCTTLHDVEEASRTRFSAC